MQVSQYGKLFLGQRSQDSLNFGFHLGHPSCVAGHANNSRFEAKRNMLPLVEITLTINVTADLNGKSAISVWRYAPMHPLRKRVLKAVGLIRAKQTLAHWHRLYHFQRA